MIEGIKKIRQAFARITKRLKKEQKETQADESKRESCIMQETIKEK